MGNKHKLKSSKQKSSLDDHKKFKKLEKRIDGHLAKVSHLQHKIFKTLLKVPRIIHNDEEYEAVKGLVGMYRENEKDLSKIVKLYEAHMEAYEEEKNFKK